MVDIELIDATARDPLPFQLVFIVRKSLLFVHGEKRVVVSPQHQVGVEEVVEEPVLAELQKLTGIDGDVKRTEPVRLQKRKEHVRHAELVELKVAGLVDILIVGSVVVRVPVDVSTIYHSPEPFNLQCLDNASPIDPFFKRKQHVDLLHRQIKLGVVAVVLVLNVVLFHQQVLDGLLLGPLDEVLAAVDGAGPSQHETLAEADLAVAPPGDDRVLEGDVQLRVFGDELAQFAGDKLLGQHRVGGEDDKQEKRRGGETEEEDVPHHEPQEKRRVVIRIIGFVPLFQVPAYLGPYPQDKRVGLGHKLLFSRSGCRWRFSLNGRVSRMEFWWWGYFDLALPGGIVIR